MVVVCMEPRGAYGAGRLSTAAARRSRLRARGGGGRSGGGGVPSIHLVSAASPTLATSKAEGPEGCGGSAPDLKKSMSRRQPAAHDRHGVGVGAVGADRLSVRGLVMGQQITAFL